MAQRSIKVWIAFSQHRGARNRGDYIPLLRQEKKKVARPTHRQDVELYFDKSCLGFGIMYCYSETFFPDLIVKSAQRLKAAFG